MNELAAGDNAYVGAQFFHDLQHVRGEENGRAASDALLECVTQDARGDSIDALERLVQKQQVRVGKQRSGQGEFLLHPMRELEGELFLLACEIHHREQFVATLADGSRWQKIHATDESEIFAGGEVVEERKILRHHANPAFDLKSLSRVAEILAEKPDGAASGREQAGEHLDGGGFAGAVGAEETIETARFNPEIELIDSTDLPEVTCQVGGFDGRGHDGFNAKCRGLGKKATAEGVDGAG